MLFNDPDPLIQLPYIVGDVVPVASVITFPGDCRADISIVPILKLALIVVMAPEAGNTPAANAAVSCANGNIVLSAAAGNANIVCGVGKVPPTLTNQVLPLPNVIIPRLVPFAVTIV